MNDISLAPAIDAARGSRNAPCVCGSGRRYKTCHGRIAAHASAGGGTLASIMHASLAAQRAGRLDDARRGYETVLARHPDTPDALNMLGVIDLAQGDVGSALRHLRRAVALFEGRHPEALHNLACVVSARILRDETERSEALWLDAIRESAAAPRRTASGRISVVVPSHDHAAYVGEALGSALDQERQPDEIVVVDDGSTDGSVARIRALMRRHPGRIRLVAREGRGAAATINEAVGRATGDWINILNSDDRFAPDRLARMHEAVAGRGDGWGFSRCRFIDAAGRTADAHDRIDLASHRALIDGIGACDTVGFAFLPGNPAISTGALFFARTLWERLGGFRDLRYNHDWDFCLRATLLAEPVFAAAPLYDYRVHGRNTIHEPESRRDVERRRMLVDHYRDVIAAPPPANRYAPSPHAWGRLFFVRAIERGHATLLPSGTVERLADEILARGEEDDGAA